MDNLDELIIDDLRLDGMATAAVIANETSPSSHVTKASHTNGNSRKPHSKFNRFNSNKTSTSASNGHSNSGSKHFNHSKSYQNKSYQSRDGGQSTTQPTNPTISKSKKAKRLPWNAEILKDRFTPQTFHVQLIDLFLNQSEIKKNAYEEENEAASIPNLIIFIKSEEWKSYLSIMAIKQYAIRLNDHNPLTCRFARLYSICWQSGKGR